MKPFSDEDFLRQRHRLLALARRWLGNAADAEDVVQDTWLRVQAELQGPLRNGEAWLVTVLRHTCIDRLRRRRTELLHASMIDDEVGPSAEDLTAASIQTQALLSRLAHHVPAGDVAALLLHAVFGFSHAEIGALAGQSTSAVRQRVHRAKLRVQSPTDPEAHDSDAQEALITLCWRALRCGDATALIARIKGAPTQLQGSRGDSVAVPARSEAALLQVDGVFALALIFDGVVLCTVPLGPTAQVDDGVLFAS